MPEENLRNILDAKVLGQLLLMQSVLNNLPDEKSIWSFVCKGLLDVPGVKDVTHKESSNEAKSSPDIRFPIVINNELIGNMEFNITDFEQFNPYRKYLKNFVFTLGIILQERQLRQREKEYKEELERRVEERTKLLSNEIDERRKIEDELKHQNHEYQALNEEYISQNEELLTSLERIQKFNEKLAQAKKQAEESNQFKTNFIANISHEIRTPMNGILGFADLLKNSNLTGPKKDQFIDIILRSGNRMLNIINDLIDITKIESGQEKLYYEEVNIHEMAENLFDFFSPEAEKKDVYLLKKIHHNGSSIVTDKTKLNQILTNLIKNALKFTKDGYIELGYNMVNKHHLFYVKDSGEGIPKNQLKIIFERFGQANLKHSKGEEGLGLGLTISKAYVEMLGGTLNVSSTVNKGTRFSFNLPYKTPETKNQTNIDITIMNDNSNNSQKILIVEDDEISYLLLKENLEAENFNIQFAPGGVSAIELIKEGYIPDLILMDIKMPEIDGFEATLEIKKMLPNIPVIAQSAFASEDDMLKAQQAGCDDYITKPIDKNALMSKILACLNS